MQWDNPSLTYADIGLVPLNLSKVESRSDVQFPSVLDQHMNIPVLIAPMETVVDARIANRADTYGMRAVLPRRPYNPDLDINEFFECNRNTVRTIPSLPTEKHLDYLLDCYMSSGQHRFCIDVANGFHVNVGRAVKRIREVVPDAWIMTGNVGSYEGYHYLEHLGVDAVRVGIGGGSVCSTSVATGIGMGQASLVREVADYKVNVLAKNPQKKMPLIIADGGIKNVGDICKAIALGADLVMCGGLFAGLEESPGDIIEMNGKKYKEFCGQASKQVKRDFKFEEGVKRLVPIKGAFKDVARQIEDGIRSCCAYLDCKTVDELRYLPDEYFLRLSNASHQERHPHA